MKITKRIISLLVSAMMLTTMLGSITAFADADPSVVIDPLYVDDFENPNYGHSINTGNSVAANAWYDLNGTNFFSNKNTGHGETWDGSVWAAAGGAESGVEKPAHWYSYNVKTMADDDANSVLYIRQETVLSVGYSKLLAYVEDAVAEGADSYSVKFDVKPENLDAGGYGRFEWSYSAGDRSAILFADGKVYYKMHKSGSDPSLDDCTVVEGVSFTEDEFVTIEYAWEKGTSIWKINGKEIVKELKYDSAVASVPTREIYFHSSAGHALQLDNFEVKAYKFKPSPNSVWFEDKFETYADNTSQGSDAGVTSMMEAGVLSTGKGGSTTYKGEYARYSSIMKADGNQYLRIVTGGSSGADATPFTKFADYITECGAESFIIEFDVMLDTLPTSPLEIRYKKSDTTNGIYMMLFFKGSELYCKYDGSNNWTDYLEPIDGITIAADQWNRISYAYNDGVLRVYFNNVLVMSKDGFEDALGAAYSWLHFGSSASNAALNLDNLKFTCYSSGDDTIKSTFTGNATAGNDVTVTTTYESRLVVKPFTQFAVYDADTNALINIYDGVVAAPAFIGDGKITATATVPADGNVILKPLAWTRGLKPIKTFGAITVE